MKTAIFVLLFVTAFAVGAPVASAEPPTVAEACGAALGEGKCEALFEEIRERLLCTCPPL